MKTKLIILFLIISCQYALAFNPSVNKVYSWFVINIPRFIENKGQLCDVKFNPAPYLLFKLQQQGTDVYITEFGLSYVFKHSEEKPKNTAAGIKEPSELPEYNFKQKDIITHYCRADMELVGADIRKENILKEYGSTDYCNYYLSNCPDGVMEVKSYGKITIKEIYPGIDWVIYNTTAGGMKYDFVVQPYADPSKIKLRYKWTDKPEQIEGSITIATPLGKVTEGKPYGCNSGNAVDVSYNIEDKDIGFKTGAYNTNEILIIDPQLLWATYYGGNNDDIAISTYSDGTNLWVTGTTYSLNFPVQNLSGAYNQGTIGGSSNAFILKFSTSGVRQWATYYGGNSNDYGYSIYSDGTNLWVTGNTSSTDFPLQFLSSAYNQGTYGGNYDSFILKFSTLGIRQWATYYGGNNFENGRLIYNDGTSVWVTGGTSSTDFPLQSLSGAFNQETYGGGDYDAFILEFNASGVRQWATYYGGNDYDAGTSLNIDGTNVWVTGTTYSSNFPIQSLSGAYNQGTFGGGSRDVFIIKFSTTGVRHWATYYGGNNAETGLSIRSEDSNVWVTGFTGSTNFPLQNLSGGYNQGAYGGGLYDAFILEFTTMGVRQWATYYGGSGYDAAISMYTDNTGIWLTGETGSANFPLLNLPGAYNQGTIGGGSIDAFILRINTFGVRQWASFYGGNGDDQGRCICVDNANLWITGYTQSSNFPIQNLTGAYNQSTNGGADDTYILKFTSDLTGINPISNEIPASYKLYNNYPNPFNPTTSIRFDLPKNSSIKLLVFDLLGREIATLVNEQLNAGSYEADWSADKFASGVYYYTLQTENYTETKKMILVK